MIYSWWYSESLRSNIKFKWIYRRRPEKEHECQMRRSFMMPAKPMIVLKVCIWLIRIQIMAVFYMKSSIKNNSHIHVAKSLNVRRANFIKMIQLELVKLFHSAYITSTNSGSFVKFFVIGYSMVFIVTEIKKNLMVPCAILL